jgi:hypothetical protein
MNWILVTLILVVTSQVVDGTGDFVSNDIHMITIYYDVYLHTSDNTSSFAILLFAE